MPASKHPDEHRIKSAMRQLYLSGDVVGKLPSIPKMRELFEQEELDYSISPTSNLVVKSRQRLSKDDRLSTIYASVLKERKTVGEAVLRRCRDAVLKEFHLGMNIIDARILDIESEPRISDDAIWPKQPPDYDNPDSLIDDNRADLILLNKIHRGVFGSNLPTASAELAVRLRASLMGLEPAAKTFLLIEYAIRNSIRKRLKRTTKYASGDPVHALAETKDIDFLIATKPWQWSQNFVVPYDYMSSTGNAPQLDTWVVLLEPLCLPEWEKVREWYLLALYNNAASLHTDSQRLALQITARKSLPITWQTILQHRAGWHGFRK